MLNTYVAATGSKALLSVISEYFKYFILDFLPHGSAYTDVDYHIGGYFIWLCILTLLFCGLILTISSMLKNTLRKRYINRTVDHEKYVLWEKKLQEMESIISK